MVLMDTDFIVICVYSVFSMAYLFLLALIVRNTKGYRVQNSSVSELGMIRVRNHNIFNVLTSVYGILTVFFSIALYNNLPGTTISLLLLILLGCTGVFVVLISLLPFDKYPTLHNYIGALLIFSELGVTTILAIITMQLEWIPNILLFLFLTLIIVDALFIQNFIMFIKGRKIGNTWKLEWIGLILSIIGIFLFSLSLLVKIMRSY